MAQPGVEAVAGGVVDQVAGSIVEVIESEHAVVGLETM